jgi:hypothetical protein
MMLLEAAKLPQTAGLKFYQIASIGSLEDLPQRQGRTPKPAGDGLAPIRPLLEYNVTSGAVLRLVLKPWITQTGDAAMEP